MKTQSLLMLTVFSLFSLFSFAQTQKVSTKLKEAQIKVWGNCGMCKTRIEKAAKSAGATVATWDEDTKMLTVKYAANKTNTNAIQQKVAAVGHDTKDFTAPDDVYAGLHGCCKYDRKADAASTDTANADCCKDKANCPKDGSCCKPGSTAECCKDKSKCAVDGSCCKANHHQAAADCCKDKANCPKDGSCCKAGSTADCCKDKASCPKDGSCCKASADKAMACCKDKTKCTTDGSCCKSAAGCCSK
jgi:hypothetical protein